jgi:hypothetical protein
MKTGNPLQMPPSRARSTSSGSSRRAKKSDKIERARGITAQPRPQNYTNLWWSVYEAADRSDFKGYFFLPNLTPADQVNVFSERSVIERVDFLYKNVGAVKIVIDGLALYEVGTGLWPKWDTGSDGYDKAMTDAFHFANHDPRVFSADGQNDYYCAQYNIRRLIRLYGDCFGMLLRPAPGGQMPSMALFPGYMIDNSGKEGPEENWKRGVLRNRLNFPLKYRVLATEHGNDSQDVEADDMLHFHDPFLPGQIRGVPTLAASAKKLYRREDIGKALANGTLARERIGYVLQLKDQPNLGGPSMAQVGTSEVQDVVSNDGRAKYTVQKIFGLGTENQVAIPELNPGEEIKTVESNRPGTASMEFLDSILRETAWDAGYPPDFVFFVLGTKQGTDVRRVLQQVKTVINTRLEFQLKPQFLNRYNVYFAWQRIKAGMFDDLKDAADAKITVPDNWWKHKIIPPPDLTVDVGREGRLNDERVESNKMSIDAYHGLNGEDSGDVEDENLAVIERRLKKLDALNTRAKTKFTYFDIWSRSGGFVRDAGAPDPGSDLPGGKQPVANPDDEEEIEPGNNGNGKKEKNRLQHV